MYDRILQIIIYVVQELHNNKNLNDIQVNNLHTLGYTDVEISTAISWLVDTSGMDAPIVRNSNSFRIFNEIERDLFTNEALNDLMQFMSLGLVNNEQIDYIIDKALLGGIHPIDRTILGYIIMAFVFKIAPDNRIGNRIMLSGKDTIH